MKKRVLTILGIVLLASLNLKAQEAVKNYFIVVSTMHTNQLADNSTIKNLQQEYYDKVTSKNKLIVGSEIMNHYFTENSSEVLLVSVFNSWTDIEKSDIITEELIEKGWPNKDERTSFFEKYNNIYLGYHSDEIYKSINILGKKELTTDSKKPLVIYIRKTQFSLAKEEGQQNAIIEYNEKVVLKNPYILAYYPQTHFWGADSREFLEVSFFNSLSDIDKSNEKELSLTKEAWPNESIRKTFMDKMNKGFNGIHKDFIYHNEPSMSK
jgi:hypothetical protein